MQGAASQPTADAGPARPRFRAAARRLQQHRPAAQRGHDAARPGLWPRDAPWPAAGRGRQRRSPAVRDGAARARAHRCCAGGRELRLARCADARALARRRSSHARHRAGRLGARPGRHAAFRPRHPQRRTSRGARPGRRTRAPPWHRVGLVCQRGRATDRRRSLAGTDRPRARLRHRRCARRRGHAAGPGCLRRSGPGRHRPGRWRAP